MEVNKSEMERIKQSARRPAYVALGAFGIFVIMFALLLFVFTDVQSDSIGIIFGILFAVIAISLIMMNIKQKKYRSMYKDYYVKQSINQIFDDATYDPNRGISFDTIASTKMLNMGDRFDSSDYVVGKYKNVNVELSDVHIQEVVVISNGKTTTTTYTTIFRGRWMIFDFNKTFKSNIRVASKNFFGGRSSVFSKLKRVKLESEAFNKKFYVLGDNEHDVFYILTPQLMEKIENLSDSIGGRVMLCFVNNKLHVAINNGLDNFEPTSIFSNKTDEEILERVGNEIRQITMFVDKLDIDTDIFKEV